MKKIIGIDLGTTNSLVSVWKDGKSTLIPNAFGEYLTPSIVSFGDDGTVYVGKTAKERLITHPDTTYECFKRGMGKKTMYGNYSPVELSSLVLRSLKEDAESFLGEPIDEAVISVPAYFDDKARKATKNAGQLAGLKVNRILNEPSAAALGYLRGVKECSEDEFEEKIILVFDFGGGTLDISLLETFSNVIEIISVSGNNMLGGLDFDKAIASYFMLKHNIRQDKISQSEYNSILKAAENLKKDLTLNSKAKMMVRTPNINKDLEITSSELIKISTNVLKKISAPIQEVLRQSEMSIDDITDVVLVGGTSRMPVVQHCISRILERDDIEVVSPDLLVGIGMGVYAGIKERNEKIRDLILTDVCPYSLGTSVYNHYGKRALSSFIIPRNTALPVSSTHIYTTVNDDQKAVVVDVFQGEEMYADQNIKMGEIKVDFPSPAPKNTPVFISFTYDLNGILVVDIEVPYFGIEKNEVLIDNEVNQTNEEIKERLEILNSLRLSSRKSAEDSQILEWAERIFPLCNNRDRNELSRRLAFYQRDLQDESDPYKKKKIRKYMKNYLLALELVIYQNNQEVSPFDNSWMNEEDEEIEKLFSDWDEDNNK